MSADANKVRTLFLTAVEQHAPDQWAAYLAEACEGDDELRQRVEVLLKAHVDANSLLDHLAPDQPPTLADEPLREAPGIVIGPYKLLQQLGEGGMGVVWMAEQSQPVQRKVALKVIKPGMDSRQVIARFEAERQALALMDHVNIARVFDGGTTENGRPYFVMELVHGVPITKYCDDNHLTPRERLELFVPVCQAIQHAHQKGIIHRDIKPSNVMVTLYDGKPVPKVIDFGVAKAVEQKLTERTLFTQYGTMVGTLEYMSPEQAEMSALGVDTRSDIYSLGVLLYELLTGSTPLTHKRMKEAAYAEILRMIKEVEPPRPSARLSDSGEALASISALRHTEPAKLTKLVKGELDWIVMKTLDKDRNRRYETANGFAADVQRYLNDEAVQACPPSAMYRLRKLVRRNKVALFTIALVAMALLAGTIISTWQAIRATNAEKLAEERLRAEQDARHDAEKANDKASVNFGRARDAVKRMLTRVAQDELADVPWMEPVRKVLLEDALQFYEQLLVERTTDPEIRLATALARLDLAWTSGWHGETAPENGEGIRLALELLEPLVKEFGEDWRHRAGLARALHLKSHQTAWKPNHWKEAEQLLRRALELQESVVSATPDSAEQAYQLADTLQMLGNALSTGGQAEEAEAVYRRAISIGERFTAKDPNDPGHLRAQVRGLTSIAGLLSATDPAQAETLLLQAQALAARFQAARRKTGILFDTSAYALAAVDQGLGELYHAQGRTKEAQTCLRSAWAVYLKYTSDFPSIRFYRERLAWASHRLADSLTDPMDTKETENLYRQTIEVHEKLVADFPEVVIYRKGLSRAYRALGELLEATGRVDEAENTFRQGLTLSMKHSGGPDELEYRSIAASICNRLGQLLERGKRPEEAEEPFRQALTLFQANAAAQPTVLDHSLKAARGCSRIAHLLRGMGRLDDARKGFQETIKLLEKLVAEFPKELEVKLTLSTAYQDFAVFEEAGKRPVEAEAGFRKALELTEHAAATFPDQANAWESLGHKARMLGWHLRRSNRPVDAEKTHAKAVQAFDRAGTLPGASTHNCRYLAAESRRAQAEAVLAQKRPKDAGDLFRKAVEDCYRLPGDFLLQKADRHRNVAGGIDRYAGFLRSQGRPQEAIEVMQQGIDFYLKLSQDMPKEGSFRAERVERLRKFAWFLATSPNPKIRDGKRAVELAKSAVELTPESGSCWNTLGAAYFRAGEWEGAIAALQKSTVLRKGGDSLDWFFLAMAQARLKNNDEARKWYDQAVAWMEDNQPENEELRRFRVEAATLLGVKEKRD